jgi:hypothetical protein
LPKREGERERERGRELTIKIPSKLPGRDQLVYYNKRFSLNIINTVCITFCYHFQPYVKFKLQCKPLNVIMVNVIICLL